MDLFFDLGFLEKGSFGFNDGSPTGSDQLVNLVVDASLDPDL